VVDEVGVVTIADAQARRLSRIDPASRRALVAFLRSPRYEVLPTDDVEERVLATVPREVRITVTASPRRGIDATIDLARRLAGHGYAVVPHLSARLIRDESHLKDVLGALTAMGAKDVFVIAGDASEPAGRFADSVSLLEAMKAEQHVLRDIGVTGYPDRNSFIDDDLTIQAMWDKRRLATYIVSLRFNPRVVKKWVARVRRRSVQLPIHVGMAGVADPTKLLRVSSRIGVVDSARFLRGHSDRFLRTLQPGGYSPGRPGAQGGGTARVHVQRDRADAALAPGAPGAFARGLRGGQPWL